jgi:quercetin dioxygenase-like cupin family protein
LSHFGRHIPLLLVKENMMLATALAPFTRRTSLENTYTYAGGTISILVAGEDTGGAFALIEANLQPGSEPPLHVHEREDELFYILEGSVRVIVGGRVHELASGESIFLPRGIPHTFRIQSERARSLNVITPAGFETWFRTIGTPAENMELAAVVPPPAPELLARMQELSAKLGVQVLGDPASNAF